MSDPDPARTLLSLLAGERRHAGRTILVTGPWGCGKTFLWKQSIAPHLQRPQIYVSAFGAEDAGKLKGRLLTHFALRLLDRVPVGSGINAKAASLWSSIRDRFGRTGKAIASSLNSIGGSFLRTTDIDPLELADLLPASTVLCIDDIERISATFNIEDLLGIINVLSEHKGFDVVIICNQDQIINGDKARAEVYLRHKEKAVSTEIHVSADPAVVFERIAKSVAGSEEALKRVMSAKSVVLDVFLRSKTENLRVLSKVCAHLEAMLAAGVRELADTEVRFLTAVAVHASIGEVHDDNFFDFNPLVLRLAAAIGARTRPEEPREIARKEFLARYFGETDYEFHAGIMEAVRRGRIDPDKFVRPPSPEVSALQETLVTVRNGVWRFWGDAEVRELLRDLVGHLEAGKTKTAREVFECLAYARFLASLLGESVAPTVSGAAEKALGELAAIGDTSLGTHWSLHMGDLMPSVKSEYDAFVRAARGANQKHLIESIAGLIQTGDIEGIARTLAGREPEPFRAVYVGVGPDVILELLHSNPKMFDVLLESLIEGDRGSSSAWPEGRNHLRALVKRLQEIQADESEENMVRWRIKSLLSRVAWSDNGEA